MPQQLPSVAEDEQVAGTDRLVVFGSFGLLSESLEMYMKELDGLMTSLKLSNGFLQIKISLASPFQRERRQEASRA